MATVRRDPLHVFYDGACPVCTRSIAWAVRLDHHERLHTIPACSPQAENIVGPLHAPKLLDELHVWSKTRGVRSGVDALAAVLGELPGLGWVGRFITFPLLRPLAKVVYRRVSRERVRVATTETVVLRPARRPLSW